MGGEVGAYGEGGGTVETLVEPVGGSVCGEGSQGRIRPLGRFRYDDETVSSPPSARTGNEQKPQPHGNTADKVVHCQRSLGSVGHAPGGLDHLAGALFFSELKVRRDIALCIQVQRDPLEWVGW